MGSAGRSPTDRSYLSIREVLDLLVVEFPDVTISKIRFLESRGLISPERTPSGYRKFYESDVDRLRWILRQQREHFLPLKVIKGRLESVNGNGAGETEEPSLFDSFAPEPSAPPTSTRPAAAVAAVPAPAPAPAPAPSERIPALTGAGLATARAHAVFPRAAAELVEEEPAPRAEAARADAPHAETAHTKTAQDETAEAGQAETVHNKTGHTETGHTETGQTETGHTETGHVEMGHSATPRAEAPRTEAPRSEPVVTDQAGAPAAEVAPPEEAVATVPAGRPPRRPVLGDGELTAEALAAAAGTNAALVAELEEYGLLECRLVAGVHCYPQAAVELVHAAAGFARFGIEARHLRTFKHAAERETSLYDRVVTPLLLQRNPTARASAEAQLHELVELGAALQGALVQGVLRNLLGG